MGSAVILAAETLDTGSIAAWLSAFAATHSGYLNAQDQVTAHEKLVAQAKRELDACNASLDTSLDRLGVALIMNGQPRLNPFRGYKIPSPALLQRRAAGSKAVSVHRLADSVLRRMNANADVPVQAAATDAAATAVERAIAAVNQALAALATSRFGRDAIGRQWDRDLSALRHAAAAASAESYLAQRLFAGIRRPKKSPKKKAARE